MIVCYLNLLNTYTYQGFEPGTLAFQSIDYTTALLMGAMKFLPNL